METHIAEIAPNIYRLSTYVEEADFMFNQFLVVDEDCANGHALVLAGRRTATGGTGQETQYAA